MLEGMVDWRDNGDGTVDVKTWTRMTWDQFDAYMGGELRSDHGLRGEKGRLAGNPDFRPVEDYEEPTTSEPVADTGNASQSDISLGGLLAAGAVAGLGVLAFKAWKGRNREDDEEVVEAEPVDDEPSADMTTRTPRTTSSTPRIDAPPLHPMSADRHAELTEQLRRAKAMRDTLDQQIRQTEWELRHAQVQPDEPKQVKPTPPPLPPTDHRLITPADTTGDTTFKSVLERLGWRRNHPAGR